MVNFSLVFDGTSRLGEVLAVVVHYIENSTAFSEIGVSDKEYVRRRSCS